MAIKDLVKSVFVCPFCSEQAFILSDYFSVCGSCFRRWETEYTDKLMNEYKGEYYGKKTKETET